MTNIAKKILFIIIRGYQKLISPFLPARCRYYPTCSTYGLQAIAWHGAKHGGWLTIKRICRCHPLGGHGVDFVPLPLYHFQFQYVEESTLTGKQYQTKTVALRSQPKVFQTSHSNSSFLHVSIRENFVYIDTMDYTYQLNQWLKQPVIH